MGRWIGFDIKTETPEAWTSEKLVFDRGDLKYPTLLHQPIIHKPSSHYDDNLAFS